MKKALLGLFSSLIFLTSASIAFADGTASPLGFYCDPYNAEFTNGQAYLPSEQSNNCTFTNQNTGPMGYLVFRGTPTPGGANYLQFGTNDGSSPFTLSNVTFSTSGSPNQPGDTFFAISFAGGLAEAQQFNSYFSTGAGSIPEDYNMVTFHWGAPATVTANNTTMYAGSAVPTLTATMSGFVNGDTYATSGTTGAASCTTTATSASPAGTYPITCTTGTLVSSRYTFEHFVGGTLTVLPVVDTQPPVIKITSPLDQTLYAKTDSVYVTATVTDQSAIATTTYWFNGVRINPTNPLPLGNAPAVSKVSVAAKDVFGNSATSTVTIFVVKSTNSCLLDIIAILTQIAQDKTLPSKPTLQNLIADCSALIRGFHHY